MRAQHLKLSRGGEGTGYVLAVENIALNFSTVVEVRDIATVQKRLAAKSSLTLPVEIDQDEWEHITDNMLAGLSRMGVGLWKFQPDPFVKIRAAQKLYRERGIRVPPEEL